MFLPLFLCLSITTTTLALSPQEFRRFYHQATSQITKQPNFGSRFPPHNFKNHNDEGYTNHGFNPNREPHRNGGPFNNHQKFHTLNRPNQIQNEDTRFPFRPETFNQHGNSFLQNDFSLVKLRKLYSQFKRNKKNPNKHSPTRKFTIKPDYIRNHFANNNNNNNHQHPHHQFHQQHSLYHPIWSPFREGRKDDNKIYTYISPDNKSIIFQTRLHAAIGVEDKYGESMKFDQLPKFLEEFHNMRETNRSKRFSINEKLLQAFYAGSLGKMCSTDEGDKGECLTPPQCHLTRGSSKYSKDCTFGACCTRFINRCAETIMNNNTIWESPNITNKAREIGTACSLRIAKLSDSICHLRLDLREFQLKGPANGSCLEDRFLVKGQNINSVIPQLCGVATGDHLYIDVDNSSGPVELNFINVGSDFKRKWKIQISQIECNNPNQPPRNCLQYFTETSGTFGSFNRQNTPRQYLNNLNYAVCLKKGAGYCSIQYEVSPNTEFNFINQEGGVATVPTGTAGVGAVDCPDDYITVAGNRLCGDRLNDGSLPSMSENTKVKDLTNGPFIIQVKSNANRVRGGFQLNYQQLPC